MKTLAAGTLVLASVMTLGLLPGCVAESASLVPAPGNKTSTYGSPKAENFPTGSREWWDAMQREGRTGSSQD